MKLKMMKAKFRQHFINKMYYSFIFDISIVKELLNYIKVLKYINMM